MPQILIAEDQAIIQRILNWVCTTVFTDPQVTMTSCVEEAYQRFQATVEQTGGPPHLIITDMNMPVRPGQFPRHAAGLILTRAVRRQNRSVPILAYTGLHKPEIIAKIQQAGINAYLPKESLKRPQEFTACLQDILPAEYFKKRS
jgi:CheY-like chemotaxis protein